MCTLRPRSRREKRRSRASAYRWRTRMPRRPRRRDSWRRPRTSRVARRRSRRGSSPAVIKVIKAISLLITIVIKKSPRANVTIIILLTDVYNDSYRHNQLGNVFRSEYSAVKRETYAERKLVIFACLHRVITSEAMSYMKKCNKS